MLKDVFKKLSISAVALFACVCVFLIPAYAEEKADENTGTEIMNIVIPVSCTEPATVKLEAVTPDAPMPEKDVISLAANKTDSYQITFLKPETYVYKAYQIDKTNSKITYDDTEYEIEVCIFYNDDNVLSGNVVVKGSKDKLKVATMHFDNKKIVDPAPPGQNTNTNTGTGAPVLGIVILCASIAALAALIIGFTKKNKKEDSEEEGTKE